MDSLKLTLKPCPFCGKPVEAMYFDAEMQQEYIFDVEEDRGKPFFFRCYECDFVFIPPGDTPPEDVFALWNKRY